MFGRKKREVGAGDAASGGNKYEEAKPFEAACCTGCGCLVDPAYAVEVEVIPPRGSSFASTTDTFVNFGTVAPQSRKRHYCRRCKPPYDRVELAGTAAYSRYFRKVPEQFIEVNEDGSEIKPTKA